jgi:MinD-like ATPase involved in chromosome partitioning or flagellar assembly
VIVGVGSWRGLGATTTALSIAASMAADGAEPWLVEADPAGGVLAARLTIDRADAGSLERLAFPTTRSSTADRFEQAAVRVAGVRVITAPGDAFRAWGCHVPRLAWPALLRELDAPVVVDVGRLHGGGPGAALLSQLDLLMLVANPDTVSLAATMEWADALGKSSPGDKGLPLDLTRVAVVDAPIVAERVSRTDAETELGDRFAGWLPWVPDTVQLLHRGAAFTDRRVRRQPLAQAIDHLVVRLRHWLVDEEAA